MMSIPKIPIYLFLFIYIYFLYPLTNIMLRGVINDHRTDTHVPGTNGHNIMGYETLTTPVTLSLLGAGRASTCPAGFGVLSQSVVHLFGFIVLSIISTTSLFTFVLGS